MTSHDKMSTWLSWCIYEEGGTFISLYHKQRCDSLLDICYLHLMKKRGVIYTDKLVINQFAFHQGIHVCYPLDLKKETYFSFLSVGFPLVTFFFLFFFYICVHTDLLVQRFLLLCVQFMCSAESRKCKMRFQKLCSPD